MNEAAQTVLVVDDLVAGYGDVTILDGVSLEVARGEIAVVLGGSGSGKSTLLRCIVGLLRPRRGRVLIDGRDVHASHGPAREEILRHVGMSFQSAALLNSMTVAENVALPIVEHWRLDLETALMMARMRLGLPSCPAACRSGPGSRARWRSSPRCCSATSRPPASIRSPAASWTS
jgi:phospholipid/cholesterol/gamma-HCH transport system ATP-binding protein